MGFGPGFIMGEERERRWITYLSFQKHRKKRDLFIQMGNWELPFIYYYFSKILECIS